MSALLYNKRREKPCRPAILLLAVAIFFLLSPSATAQTPNNRYAAIVIDAATGQVLHERHADKSLHPASLVKMMTLLLAFEGLENGTLTLNQRIRISNHAAAQPPSKIGLPAGSSMTVRDAIYALVTKSANDVATALGEGIGGSESQFVHMMNRKARELGMSSTRFYNAHGLHHPQQVSTARDMARLSRHLVLYYPKQYRYFSTRNFSFNGTNYHNHNRLMETYDGMDGIKTGFINASGFNLAASAVRDDVRLIAVVFGGRTSQSRNAHMAELLDQSFARIGRGTRPAPQIAATPAPTQMAQQTTGTVPLPPRKPGSSPTVMAGAVAEDLSGQGDLDPAAARRFETGMLAIAAARGEREIGNTPPTPPREQAQTTSFYPGSRPDAAQDQAQNRADESWSIQIGAFTSRVRGDQALNEAVNRLPAPIRASAVPVIVPLKAGDGWVFRARIRGLTREQAASACQYFSNCMAISPRAF